MVETGRNARVLGPLKVGLRRDLHFTRQRTRGGPRYLVHDPITFQNHAFSVADYQILTALVPQRSLGATLAALVQRGVLADTPDDHEGFYRFVLWLHGTGLLHLPIANGDVLFERHQRRRAARRGRWYQVLLSQRIPLGNPDALLGRLLPVVGWIFAAPGLLLWAALLALVVWKCFDRFDELFAQTSTMLALANLPVLWLALVGLKAIHEFGHALACRRFGAPVPEMGIVLIMLTPCAYVDASASWRLERPGRRAFVALAGMYVESFVAAVAALVWAGTAPGFLHDLVFNVVVLASLVTVLFNINPLLRYDGYYLFSDLAGVFNLQQRALAFLRGWTAWLVLGTPRPTTVHTRAERLLYAVYGPATFVYRIALAVAITALVATRWPGAGIVLAAVFAWALLLQPAAHTLIGLWNTDLPGARTRARLVVLGSTTLLPLLLAVVPISWHVTAPGVLDPQAREVVRAPAAGFVRLLHVRNGQQVAPGAPLGELHNPQLEARRDLMRGELAAEAISLDAIEIEDPTQAAVHRARVAFLGKGVAEIEHRLRSMQLRAAIAGTVASTAALQLTGRFLQEGDELFQIQSEHRFLRVVLTEEGVSRARLKIGDVAAVRFTCDPSRTIAARVHEIRKAASRDEIPLALTILAGGEVYATPSGETRAVADRPYLHVLLEIDTAPLAASGDGLTAHVLFPARIELLGAWLHRRILRFLDAWRMT